MNFGPKCGLLALVQDGNQVCSSHFHGFSSVVFRFNRIPLKRGELNWGKSRSIAYESCGVHLVGHKIGQASGSS